MSYKTGFSSIYPEGNRCEINDKQWKEDVPMKAGCVEFWHYGRVLFLGLYHLPQKGSNYLLGVG
jgi:hypothetical protein